jgi:hypothetical protein
MHPFFRTLMVACLAFSMPAEAQYIVVFQVNQADLLSADAGPPQVVASGSQLQLGGTPAASGGTLPYYWQWYPSVNMSDPASPNPTLTADSTQTYHLTVTDSAGCTAIDSVLITIPIGVDNAHNVYNTGLFIYPNPMHGGSLNISCPQCPPGGWPVTVRNLTGQILAESTMYAPAWQWSPQQPLPAGTMLLITVNSGTPHIFKVIVP